LRATIRSARATSALTVLVTGLDLGRDLVKRHTGERRAVQQLHAAAVVRLVALTILFRHGALQEKNKQRVAVLPHGADLLAPVVDGLEDAFHRPAARFGLQVLAGLRHRVLERLAIAFAYLVVPVHVLVVLPADAVVIRHSQQVGRLPGRDRDIAVHRYRCQERAEHAMFKPPSDLFFLFHSRHSIAKRSPRRRPSAAVPEGGVYRVRAVFTTSIPHYSHKATKRTRAPPATPLGTMRPPAARGRPGTPITRSPSGRHAALLCRPPPASARQTHLQAPHSIFVPRIGNPTGAVS